MTNGTVPTSAGLSYAIPVSVPSSNVDKAFGGVSSVRNNPRNNEWIHLRPNKLHFADVEADCRTRLDRNLKGVVRS